MCIGQRIVYEKLLKMAEQVDSGDAQNVEGQAAKMYFEALFHKGFSRNAENVYNMDMKLHVTPTGVSININKDKTNKINQPNEQKKSRQALFFIGGRCFK